MLSCCGKVFFEFDFFKSLGWVKYFDCRRLTYPFERTLRMAKLCWVFRGSLQLLWAMTPWTSLLLLVATLLELSGGLLILLGIREKLGAGSVTLISDSFNDPVSSVFGSSKGEGASFQTIMFLKNMGIIGGLILMMLHGAQAHQRESGYASMTMG